MVVDHLAGKFWLELQKEKNLLVQFFSGRKKGHNKKQIR